MSVEEIKSNVVKYQGKVNDVKVGNNLYDAVNNAKKEVWNTPTVSPNNSVAKTADKGSVV